MSSVVSAQLPSIPQILQRLRGTKQLPLKPLSGQTYTVVAIGGSAACGWIDASGEGGYLARAFRSVAQTTHMDYCFINQSKVGYGPVQYDTNSGSPIFTNDPLLMNLFTQFKPQMLVISFGMLDDVSDNTPLPQFERSLSDEIETALLNHLVVVIVTPPPVIASETDGQVNVYLQAQMAVVNRFHDPNLYVVDLHQQMHQYLVSHNQAIQMYAAGFGTLVQFRLYKNPDHMARECL